MLQYSFRRLKLSVLYGDGRSNHSNALGLCRSIKDSNPPACNSRHPNFFTDSSSHPPPLLSSSLSTNIRTPLHIDTRHTSFTAQTANTTISPGPALKHLTYPSHNLVFGRYCVGCNSALRLALLSNVTVVARFFFFELVVVFSPTSPASIATTVVVTTAVRLWEWNGGR